MADDQAAIAAQQPEHLKQLVIDAVEDYAIYLLDLDGNVISWNKGGERVHGYAEPDIVGQHHSRFYSRPAICSGEPDSDLQAALKTGRVRTEGWRYHFDGTRFWAGTTLTALKTPAGDTIGVACITRDLTEKHEQAEALKAAKDQAQVANGAKSAFLANMSHELRTPLNAILGFSEMLNAEIIGPISPKQREYVEHIHSSGTLLLALIGDVLDISKIDANALELDIALHPLEQLATEAAATVSAQARRNDVSLRFNISNGLRLRCDRRRMLQILLNLLSNAVKFTPEGGSIILNAKNDLGAVVISVEDTGIGIKPSDIPKVLAPFGQVESAMSRKQAGTGLGLPLVRRLVELHGGEFNLASTFGVGTIVTLTFPGNSLYRARPSLNANSG